MSDVFHRDCRTDYLEAVGGDGSHILTRDGRRILDAAGGAAVSCLGHSDQAVRAAIKEQIDRLAFVHTGVFTHAPMEELAAALAGDARRELGWNAKALFVSGGSEATEAALKLARQYFLEIGQPQRRTFVARRQSYHGNTLGALAIGGNEWRRRPYSPLLAPAIHIAPCYAYRDRRSDESAEAYGARLATELDAAIVAAGPETVAAFVAEPVVGATLGAVPAVPRYFQAVRAVCDRHGVLLILDEVMCGMGRTGSLFACSRDGVKPDLLTLAKGLGGGYQPIGAVLADERIHAAVRDGSGALQHGHTYMGHTLACAAALAARKRIVADGLLDDVRARGEQLMAALRERLAEHPHVGDIRGRGLMLGIELVADRANKEPFPPERRVFARVKAEALALDMLTYPMPGTVDGRRGDHILLAPPYIVSEKEVETIAERTALAIERATRGG
jgi:adenosylmethionine-8-amino-7-oxononanoate aminotransferase